MQKEDMIEKLKRELEIRNFSNKTVKSYMNSVSKFLDYIKVQELNEELVKKYVQLKVKTKEPSSVSHDIYAIQFFYKNVLGKNIFIPRPKRRNKKDD